MIRQESGQELTDLGNPVRPKLAVIYSIMKLKVVWLFCLDAPNHIDIFYGGFEYLHLCRNFLIRKDRNWSNSQFQSDRACCQSRVILKDRATSMVYVCGKHITN